MEPDLAAQALTRHRTALGWSKRRLAREASLSAAYVVQLETGDRPVTPRLLGRFADVMGVRPYLLFEEAGLIPSEAVREAEEMARRAMQDEQIVARARTEPVGGQEAWLVADYLMMLGYDPYGMPTEGPMLVGIDWSQIAPDRWNAMNSGQANAQTLEKTLEQAREWLRTEPPTPIEGWGELTDSQRRLVQQLVNQLRNAPTEDGEPGDGDA